MAHSQQNVLWISEKGGQYQIGHGEVPQPGPGFVLVKVESCALNPVDKHIQLSGIFVDKYPFIGGNDGSGTVEQVGEGVSEMNVGDKVCVEHLPTQPIKHFVLN
jgi:NADPH:quinone reductase-like Zn-dependent oxidoreductase